MFVPLGDVRQFMDVWYHLLPMDNAIDDRVIPTEYTELWIDPADAQRACRALRALHAQDPGSVGNFFTELYAAKQSPFWLAPSYTGDKIRLDVNWPEYNTKAGNVLERAPPEEYFAKYWHALDRAGVKFLAHMGKYGPPGPRADVNADYVRRWRRIREALDPAQVFVSKYWAEKLGIEIQARVGWVVLEPQEPEQQEQQVHESVFKRVRNVLGSISRRRTQSRSSGGQLGGPSSETVEGLPTSRSRPSTAAGWYGTPNRKDLQRVAEDIPPRRSADDARPSTSSKPANGHANARENRRIANASSPDLLRVAGSAAEPSRRKRAASPFGFSVAEWRGHSRGASAAQ